MFKYKNQIHTLIILSYIYIIYTYITYTYAYTIDSGYNEINYQYSDEYLLTFAIFTSF